MPDADPTRSFHRDLGLSSRKGDIQAVEFELASAMDFQGNQLLRRQIIGGSPVAYRSAECGYTGPGQWRMSTTSSPTEAAHENGEIKALQRLSR